MSDDLRTRIAAATVGHADYVSGLTRYCTCGQWSGDSTGTRIDFSRHLADTLMNALPELHPCPFCGLSHNECDCLRTTAESETVQISERGIAVFESGLTVRQAHQIETGCSQDDLCAKCRKTI